MEANSSLVKSLLLSATFATGASEKQIVGVEIRKPQKDEWFCAATNCSFGPLAVITTRDQLTTIYVVRADIADGLSPSDYRVVILFPCVTTKHTYFFWPVSASDRATNWDITAQRACDLAQKGWVRIAANMAASGYDAWSPQGTLAEPVWPKSSHDELLAIALKDRLIDTEEHPILLQLRGAF